MAAHVNGYVTDRSSGHQFGGGLQADAVRIERSGKDNIHILVSGGEGIIRQWSLYIPVNACLALGRAISTVGEGHAPKVEVTL